MFAKTVLAIGLTLTAGSALAADLYPYPARENFCPAGQQPVQLGGEISCGVPNHAIPYSSVMAHPVQKTKRVYHPVVIPLGKGMDLRGDGS